MIASTFWLMNARTSADCPAASVLRDETRTLSTFLERVASALIAQTMVSRHEFPAQPLLTPIT